MFDGWKTYLSLRYFSPNCQNGLKRCAWGSFGINLTRFPSTIYVTSYFAGGCRVYFLSNVKIALREAFWDHSQSIWWVLDHRLFLPSTLGVTEGGSLCRAWESLCGRCFGIILNRFDWFLDHWFFLPSTLGVTELELIYCMNSGTLVWQEQLVIHLVWVKLVLHFWYCDSCCLGHT